MTFLAARPAVLRRLSLPRHAVIEASAGTGKTFTLEHIVVDLIVRLGVPIERLLVVTFTEKATNELRARIRAKLVELDTGNVAAATPEEVRVGDFWAMGDEPRRRIADAVRSFDSATITTIHSFCQRILRENAFASGRLFEEEQVDGRHAFGRAMRDALRREVARDPFCAPWLEAALRRGHTVQSLEDLLWRCASSRAELRPRVDMPALAAAVDAMPVVDAAEQGLADTIKSWGVHGKTASSAAKRVYTLSKAALDARERRDLPGFVLDIAGTDLAQLVTALDGVSPAPGRAATACLAAAELARLTPTFEAAIAAALLPAALEVLLQRKREAGRYDFDDMLTLLDGALAGPRGASLAGSLRRRYSHALVDEFQDTDETQWSIFRRAFVDPAPGGRASVILVGDPKQSIYRFRGADVQTYLRACAELSGPDGSRVVLDRNYRSTPRLVDALNAVFDSSASDSVFQNDIRYTPVGCGRPDRALLDGAGAALSPVHVLRLCGELSLEAIGAVIAREVQAATSPRAPWRLDGRRLELEDFFVLTRTAREGRTIGAALRRAGIAHAYYKEDGLFQTDEARELLAVLRAIGDPDDRALRLAAWLTPFFGLSLSALDRARDVPPGHPLVERLRAWRSLAEGRDFGRLFEAMTRDSGLVRRLVFVAEGEREVTNYLHLFELLLEHARSGHVTFGELVAELAGLIAHTRLPLRFEGNVQRLETDRRAVQIMTIHKAKGLEAPVVFVAGGATSSRPDRVHLYHDDGRRLAWVGSPSGEVKDLIRNEERDEDQRLFYVALTRAQGRLYVPCVVDEARRAKKLRGSFDRVNRRIADLLAAAESLFSVEDVASPAPVVDVAAPAGTGVFRPPVEWFVERDLRPHYDRLRADHAGLVLTSYTRMKASRASTGAWTGVASPRDDDEGPGVEAAQSFLEASRSSGVFLHELLERVPLESFAGAPTFELWRGRHDVDAAVGQAVLIHRVDPGQREHAERLVWAAFMTPAQLPGGGRLDAGIASASRLVREMPFVFRRGCAKDAGDSLLIRGSVDLAFEHRGLTYLVDWKSDSLPSYSAETVARRVEERYEHQVHLYAMAVTYLLGIATAEDHERRFGGILYCFLRGFDAEGAGLWASRPSFEAMRGWAAELDAWSPVGGA